MSKNKLAVIVGGAVLAVGVSFFGGMKYGQGNNLAMARNAGNFTGRGMSATMRGTSGATGGFVSGEVIAKDDKSMTVKLQAGGSKIVFLSGSTQVVKSVSGTSADLMVGSQVTVTGGANSDGSVNAQSVQIRPFSASSTKSN